MEKAMDEASKKQETEDAKATAWLVGDIVLKYRILKGTSPLWSDERLSTIFMIPTWDADSTLAFLKGCERGELRWTLEDKELDASVVLALPASVATVVAPSPPLGTDKIWEADALEILTTGMPDVFAPKYVVYRCYSHDYHEEERLRCFKGYKATRKEHLEYFELFKKMMARSRKHWFKMALRAEVEGCYLWTASQAAREGLTDCSEIDAGMIDQLKDQLGDEELDFVEWHAIQAQ